MGVKVKCEHCRKVFEVPDDAIHKMRMCNFCQRKTWANPVEESEKGAPVPKQSYNTLFFAIVALSLVTLLNLIFTLRAMKVEEHIREAWIESPEWQSKITVSLEDIERRLQEMEQILSRNKAADFSQEEFATSIVKGWEGSIQWIHTNLIKQQNTIKEIEKRFEKIQMEIQKKQTRDKRAKEAEIKNAKSPE